MSPDDLIAAFAELAKDDSSLRIDRTKIGEADEIRLAGWASVETKHRFEGLATDAVDRFAPDAPGDPVIAWLWVVRNQAPELVEDARLRGSVGYVEIGDIGGPTERVPLVAETISHAVNASVLVVRRLRDGQRHQEELVSPPMGGVDVATVAVAEERCPTLESALIYLARQPNGQLLTFALMRVHSRCTWSSRRNGAELWDYIGQLSRGDIVDAEVRELVVPQLRTLETREGRRAFWGEILSRFPQVAGDLIDDKDCTPPNGRGSPATARPAPPSPLTVTEAATRLMDVVSDLTLKRARARVSAAAKRGRFKTNGQKGLACRIDEDSFSRWLWEQRSKELAKTDQWLAGNS